MSKTVHYPEILEISPTERDTIVAALKYWQREGYPQRHRNPEFEIACLRAAPLSPAAIDALCLRIRSQDRSRPA